MDLTTADKALGLRWALEMIRRGILVNPNEKIYISIAHSDADVERALAAADEAFAAMKR
jgi:glutamate-1-semialdehyde 2,1-aminomutase